jgi:hypothetical protein
MVRLFSQAKSLVISISQKTSVSTNIGATTCTLDPLVTVSGLRTPLLVEAVSWSREMVVGFVKALEKFGLAKHIVELPPPEVSTTSTEIEPSAQSILPTILEPQDTMKAVKIPTTCTPIVWHVLGLRHNYGD